MNSTVFYELIVEKIRIKPSKLNVTYDPDNLVTYWMKDRNTGKLKEDVLDDFFVSAIIEFKKPWKNVSE